MTRELTLWEDTFATELCQNRPADHATSLIAPCNRCIADVVHFVDGAPSETTGFPDGSYEHPLERRLEVAALDGFSIPRLGITGTDKHAMPISTLEARRLLALLRADSAPPAGDGVPEVREEDVALIRDAANRNLRSTSDRCHETGKQYARILAALSYCAKRQGEK